MNGMRFSGQRGCFRGWLTGALLWVTGVAGSVAAQTVPGPAEGPPPPTSTAAPADGGVVQASCSSCGSCFFGQYASNPGGCSTCGGACYPGRKPCDCDNVPDSCCGRLFHGIYECICCPDPCYEPHWNALADASFFADAPRPVTQMRLRYDHVWSYPFPDKAQYLWPRADGNGKGPRPPAGVGERSVGYRDFIMTNEVAIDRFGTSISTPYRQMSPDTFPGASGLGDLTIGTKSLLLDCELMQFTFAFNTLVPTGNFTKGLGTGHVSLEPALLMALKIDPDTYLQGELAYRFPLGGDNAYQGPVLHYHLSLNRLLWCCGHDLKVIGTAELNGWEILGGAFTDPVTLTPRGAKSIGDIVSIGPGLRFVICDKVDIGAAAAFAITNDSMGDEYLRVELRWRF